MDKKLVYSHAGSVIGGLVLGRCVCAGYARTFKYICDRLNIPCIYVNGITIPEADSEGNAWNYV